MNIANASQTLTINCFSGQVQVNNRNNIPCWPALPTSDDVFFVCQNGRLWGKSDLDGTDHWFNFNETSFVREAFEAQ